MGECSHNEAVKMKQLHVIKLRHFRGPSKGREGFHSVFANLDVALHALAIRKAASSDLEYWIETLTPCRVGQTYSGQTCVAFQGTVGLMLVDTRTMRDVLFWDASK